MRIALVSQDAAAVEAVRAVAASAHCEVRVHGGAEAALRALAVEPVDVLVADWFLPGIDGVELARRVAAESPMPVVVMGEPTAPEARQHALRTGAFVYLAKPLDTAALASAIQVARRSAPQPGEVVRATLDPRLTRSQIWSSYGSLVAEWMRGCTGLPLARVSESALVAADEDHVVRLAMVDVVASLELCFGIRIGKGGVSSLSQAMIGLGEVDGVTAYDLLAELCNNLLGHAKTRLRTSELDFALATPERPGTPTPPPGILAQRQAVLGWERHAMLVTMGARMLAPTSVAAGDLAENMILVDDVKSSQGAIVVPAGTRLTAVLAARVVRYLDSRPVRVAMVGT